MIWSGWETLLLGAMGIKPTKERIRFLDAWARAEGGNARWNPLNTTYHLEGATEYNSVGVRNYADPFMGIAATLLTLRLPYYRGLVRALGRDDLDARGILRAGSAGLVSWGTGTKVIAQLLA